jgi:hypothetical protein
VLLAAGALAVSLCSSLWSATKHERAQRNSDEGVTAGGPEGVPEGGPEGVPEGGPEGVPEGVPEGGPEGADVTGLDSVPALWQCGAPSPTRLAQRSGSVRKRHTSLASESVQRLRPTFSVTDSTCHMREVGCEGAADAAQSWDVHSMQWKCVQV